MNRMDKNEAPEGFIAVLVEDKGYQCETCYFGSVEIKECPGAGELANVEEVSCDSFSRADGCEVYFTKKENMNETEADDDFEYFDGVRWFSVKGMTKRKRITHGVWVRNYSDLRGADDSVVYVRSINTLVVFDVEKEKLSIDKGCNDREYKPLNDWTFYEFNF